MPEMQILLTIDFQDMSADISIVKDVPKLGNVTKVIEASIREIVNTHINEGITLSAAVSEVAQKYQ